MYIVYLSDKHSPDDRTLFVSLLIESNINFINYQHKDKCNILQPEQFPIGHTIFC